MDKSTIVLHTLETVKVYSSTVKTYIIRDFETRGLVTKDESIGVDLFGVKPVYIGGIPSNSRLDYSLSENNTLIKEIERWEFKKFYKYSMVFSMKRFDVGTMSDLLENGIIRNYADYSNDELEDLHKKAQIPSYIAEENKIYLKFNFYLNCFDNSTGKEINNRYPVLIIIDNKNSIIEYRFDSLVTSLSKNKLHYVKPVMEWVNNHINLSTSNIDYEEIVAYAKQHSSQDQVFICGQDMHFTSGGNATIDTGKDERMVLPFIGELKQMIKDNKEEFNSAPYIRDLINDFIEEKECLSNIPWTKLYFKEMNTKAKFTYNYNSENYCIIQHFYSSAIANTRKERMDYVTDYIIRTRQNIEKLKVK